MTMVSTGGFVRHRDRMVQESVIEDLKNTLIACRWMAGTTTRPVVDPYDAASGWQIVTTTDSEVLRIAVQQIKVIDYFPEADSTEEGASRTTDPNTLAIAAGQAGESSLMEMGSDLREQPYQFTMAFFARTDAVALALFNDLRDRYQGRLVMDDHVDLYNFNDPAYTDSTPPVTRMEVDAFRYAQDADTVTPSDVHLYYAELQVTDFVDGRDVAPVIPAPTPAPARSAPLSGSGGFTAQLAEAVGFGAGPFGTTPFGG